MPAGAAGIVLKGFSGVFFAFLLPAPGAGHAQVLAQVFECGLEDPGKCAGGAPVRVRECPRIFPGGKGPPGASGHRARFAAPGDPVGDFRVDQPAGVAVGHQEA